MWRLITRGEQAIFNLEIKKKSGSSLNPDIHYSKVPSSEFSMKRDQWLIPRLTTQKIWLQTWKL